MLTAAEFMLAEIDTVSVSAQEKELRDRLIAFKNRRITQEREKYEKYASQDVVLEKNKKIVSEKDLRIRLQNRMRLRLYKKGKYSLEEGELLIKYI
jgi:hypothetical protein